MSSPTSNCIRWESRYGTRFTCQILAWPMEKYIAMEQDHQDLHSQVELGWLSERYALSRSGITKAWGRENWQECHSWYEQISSRKLDKKCPRIPVGTQRQGFCCSKSNYRLWAHVTFPADLLVVWEPHSAAQWFPQQWVEDGRCVTHHTSSQDCRRAAWHLLLFSGPWVLVLQDSKLLGSGAVYVA